MTLLEVMVSMGIFSMIMLGLLEIYLLSTRLSSGNFGQLNIQRQARAGMDTIMGELRRGSTATIYNSFSSSPVISTSSQGMYFRVYSPTNSITTTSELYSHFFVSNITRLANGATNASLYYYTSTSSNTAPNRTKGEPFQIMDGITNPEMVFQQYGGAFVVNIRLVDPNDQDGKQVIFLRSSIALRNQGLY